MNRRTADTLPRPTTSLSRPSSSEPIRPGLLRSGYCQPCITCSNHHGGAAATSAAMSQ